MKNDSVSTKYGTAVFVGKFTSFIGWLIFFGGIAALVSSLMISSGQFQVFSIGISCIAFGLVSVGIGQIQIAIADTADYAREIFTVLNDNSVNKQVSYDNEHNINNVNQSNDELNDEDEKKKINILNNIEEAFCVGCRQTDKSNKLYYWRHGDIYCHKECIDKLKHPLSLKDAIDLTK